jgi:hypothetical protein
MTTASLEKQRINRFLRIYGSGTGTLVRTVGTTNQSTYSVDVRAHVRLFLVNELNEMIVQGDSKVIMSASEIVASQWPGAQVQPVPDIDIRVPRRNDGFIWKGKRRNVEAAEPIYFDDQLVRIQLQVRG